jgi:hypothetical protein
MNSDEIYRGIEFRRPRFSIPIRPILIAIGLLGFTLLWFLIPSGTLYWILLPQVAVLLWMATHGWRRALLAVHQMIHRIERLYYGGL